jgi:hypothetical protein
VTVRVKTPVTFAQRQGDAPRVDLVGLQFDCQGSSATVTNPDYIPGKKRLKNRALTERDIRRRQKGTTPK